MKSTGPWIVEKIFITHWRNCNSNKWICSILTIWNAISSYRAPIQSYYGNNIRIAIISKLQLIWAIRIILKNQFTVKIQCDVSRDIPFIRQSVKHDPIYMHLQIYDPPTIINFFTFKFFQWSHTFLGQFIYSNTGTGSNMCKIRFNEDFDGYVTIGAKNVAIRI